MLKQRLNVCWNVLLVSCSLLALGNKAHAQQPLKIVFDKSAISGTEWTGAVSGDVTGPLTTELLGFRPVGNGIIYVSFKFSIGGPQPMQIMLDGILNTNVGRVVMNGQVVEGALKGAQVHEAGQLIDPVTGRYVGLIQIMPQTSR